MLPHACTLEFTRQPETAVLAALLAAHGDELRALGLPTLTTADATLVVATISSHIDKSRYSKYWADEMIDDMRYVRCLVGLRAALS
jgi:hypothetical protein